MPIATDQIPVASPEYFGLIFTGTIILLLFAGSFVAAVVATQRRFIRAQNEKLRDVQEREAKYSDLFNNVTDIVFIHSLEGVILEINASGARAFNTDVSLLHGKSLPEIFGRAYQSRIDRYLNEINTRGVANGVFHIQLSDGTHRFFEYRNSIIKKDDQSGTARAEAVRGIIRNITAQRLAEKALRESEQRFRRLVRYSPLPMVIHVNRTIIYANETLLKLLQTKHVNDVVGERLDSFLLLDILNADEAFFLAQSSGAVPTILTERLRLLSGEIRQVETVSVPVIFDGMRAVHLVIRDITESKQLEQTLREIPHQIIGAMESERRRVAGELHDEVNQILGSIKFRMQTPETNQFQQTMASQSFFAQIERDLEKAIDEVRRISHNLRPSILDDFGLVAAVRNLCDDFTQRTHIQTNYSFESIPERLPAEMELCLFRIIQESLNNIAKHSGASQVAVAISYNHPLIEAMIADNGCGFPTTEKLTVTGEHDPTRAGSDHPKLIGIGLKTMRERATYLGGSVMFESHTPKGARVMVKLPMNNR